MHGEAIGINQTPAVVVAYVLVATALFACANFAAAPAPAHAVEHEEHDVSEFDGEPAVA
jgi:hypothetical protein